jgi:uncharacterized membrane protein
MDDADFDGYGQSAFHPDRLAAFCDGVIAIAITLLVLGLEVPPVHQVPQEELANYLKASGHAVAGYISSFVLVGMYWLQHYTIFHFVTHVDRTFVALNGLFLLAVSFVPFPTGLQSVYRDDGLAMVLYAGTQAICGLCLLLLWEYATAQRRLVSAKISAVVVQRIRRQILLTPIVSCAAMLVLLVNIELSRLMFLAIPIGYFAQRRRRAPSVPAEPDARSQ